MGESFHLLLLYRELILKRHLWSFWRQVGVERERKWFLKNKSRLKIWEGIMLPSIILKVLHLGFPRNQSFAQQVGLAEVANYLGAIFACRGWSVEIDESYTAPFVMAHSRPMPRPWSSIITMTPRQRWRPGVDRDPFTLSCAKWFYVWAWGWRRQRPWITARLSAWESICSTMMTCLSISALSWREQSESASMDLDIFRETRELWRLAVWGTRNQERLKQLEISGETREL